jgi:hypothetical protein
MIGETGKPTKVSPISAAAISSEAQGKLPRGERT